MRFAQRVLIFATVLLCAMRSAGSTTFSVPDAELPNPLVFIAYGDTRFTDAAETSAASPSARKAMIAKIAAEQPAAIFINGDLPWHGVAKDYDVYREETRRWREQNLRIYPSLGNHEFSACSLPACLERWWSTFPELRGRRWYSVAVGSKILALALDSDASLLPGSEQALWLKTQFAALDPKVEFVLIVLHHPPLSDVQTTLLADHNVRPNERALAEYLGTIVRLTHARIAVIAGHVHNYERFVEDGVVYLVSGGGGAKPYPVDRTAADLYQGTDFPNYHYIRFELRGKTLVAEMIRLSDFAAARPGRWEVRDRFELTPPP
jgi:hypothetical protein